VIRVGFWYDRPQQYSGGLNYLRNLLYALSSLGDREIQPYVFFGRRVDDAVVREFESLATVVRTSILDRMSPQWLMHRIAYRWLGSLIFVNAIASRYRIAVLSHAEHVHGSRRPYRLISWIPDFQYLHLPELFPGLDTALETKRMHRILMHTDVLLLSSYAALADFKTINGQANGDKVKVLQFVSQPHGGMTALAGSDSDARLAARYGIECRFFYLPNQFWRHKNHLVVFRAVRTLVQRGLDVILVCSGNFIDYRTGTTSCSDELRKFVSDNSLERNIRILGTIPYEDVLGLMKQCLAVINPSRFEGWSSTVEEARSLGKRVDLSRIPVHLEQAPPKASYFDPDAADELADILAQQWSNPDRDCAGDRQLAEQDLRLRTIAYARGYVNIVMDLMRR
jgi:glycosyltransferase involved in cell wall biosynthesis